MKAVQIQNYGGLDALEVRDVPTPTPGPGQALIRIRAAGVNPFDVKIRSGWLAAFYPLTLPHTLGCDYAGEVVEVGEGVTTLAPGQKVFGLVTPMQGGTYAEYLAVDAGLVRPMPAVLSFEDAAALPMVGQTALFALTTLGGLQPGQTVFVHAGSGGVGGAAIQIAKALGARVAATTSTANVEAVKALGADQVIDYKTTDFRTVLKDVDLAIDTVGGEANLATYEVMKPGGAILVVLRGDKTEMENREAMSARYGCQVKVVMFDNEPQLLDTLRDMAERGALSANVRTVLPLEEVKAAHTLSASGRAVGKIVLKVA